MGFAVSACSNDSNGGIKAKDEINVFTGTPGKNGEVLAVKFDDTSNARPQQGVEFADVVYVTQVEAGLTRLMAIYSSNYPETIGPIRSARISDIDILANYGRVGFAYSGSQSKMRPILKAANLEIMSAERNSKKIFPTDPNRTPPYAMMLHPNLLLEKYGELQSARSVGWKHGKGSESAALIDSVDVRWPNAHYQIRWDGKMKRFILWHNGKPNLAASGIQLGGATMVIQLVEIHPSEFGDRFGGITPKSTVIGNGQGYLLRDGGIVPVRWSRTDATSPTEWRLADGSEAYFAPGQVWFFLTDREPEIATKPVTNPSK